MASDHGRTRRAMDGPTVSPIVGTMTAEEVAEVVERTCTSKYRYDDPALSRSVAWRVRDRTMRPVRAYRCPFGDGTRAHAHWHVGHVPSMAALQRIADATRVRAQGVA